MFSIETENLEPNLYTNLFSTKLYSSHDTRRVDKTAKKRCVSNSFDGMPSVDLSVWLVTCLAILYPAVPSLRLINPLRAFHSLGYFSPCKAASV